MVSVMRDTHGVTQVRVSGHPTGGDLEEMATRLCTIAARDGAERLLFWLDRFCHTHDEARVAGAIFKMLVADLLQSAAVRRVAVIGDEAWAQWAEGVLQPATSVKVHHFAPTQEMDALVWIRGDDRNPEEEL